MCADFALHDKGDGNPHAHILLTIRPLKPDGRWGPKCRKVYDLDSKGNRIPDGKGGWKNHREDTTDWNNRDNAEKWRAAWAAYLFPGRNPKHHYTTRQMASWFSEILRLADIDQRKKGPHERGACLHCFRHLFVLKSMQQLEAAGRPVDMNDLLLSTYLGHDHLIDTDQYMRFSGLQVPEAMDAFETFTAGLIPHVEVPYEEE